MVFWCKKPVDSQASLTSGPSLSEEGGFDAVEEKTESNERVRDEAPKSASDQEATGWLTKLRSALKKTNQILQTDIRDLWKSEGRLVDEDFLRELFTILVRTDLGQPTAARIRDRVATDFRGRKVEMEQVLTSAREEIRAAMKSCFGHAQ